MSSIAEVKELRIKYGDFVAVENLNFSVDRGSVLGILGGNGAGKSSTLKAVCGLNPPTSGTIRVGDKYITDLKQIEQARSMLGYCPDVGGLIRQATIREHVQLCLISRGQMNRIDEGIQMVKDFGLKEFLDTPTVGFSHGMSRRLSCLLAILGAQQLLILDEPFDGVDPIGVETTLEYVDRCKTNGMGVIISTHLMSLLSKASDNVMVMVSGKKVAWEPAATFQGEQGETTYSEMLKKYTKENA